MKKFALIVVVLLLVAGAIGTGYSKSNLLVETPEQAVQSFFDLISKHEYVDAWQLVKQHGDEPAIGRAGFVSTWRSREEANPGFQVKTEILGSSLLPEWKAPQRSITELDREFPNTPKGNQERAKYLKSLTPKIVGPTYHDAAAVQVRITWIVDGETQVEERVLHLVKSGTNWNLLFHGPVDLD